MIRIADLQTALLDLLQKVHESEIRLIAGGGFGIYLKTNHVRRSGMRTLLDQWPEPRSMNDLDLFLRPELLIESSKLRPLASAIADLGYQVALDLYTILATTTEQEWEYSLHLRDQYRDDPTAKEAGNLVSEYFSSQERTGMIRLMESPYYRPELQNEEFMSALQEMFPL